MVGVEGFEPPPPCSQSRCATSLRYTPTNQLTNDRIRVRSAIPSNDAELYRNASKDSQMAASYFYLRNLTYEHLALPELPASAINRHELNKTD